MYIENIILGAGPAGIQLGYFMNKSKISYLIIEKNNCAGSFFEKFPHSKELISINKKYTGSDNIDFNLRHDWNSLLNDENFYFKEYSSDYFPNSNDLQKYLYDFSCKFNLNIKYNLEINKIDKINDIFYLYNDENLIYKCKKLIIASGLSKKIMPNIKYTEESKNKIFHYDDFDNNYFKKEENLLNFCNKNIVILGGGNSSFELANILLNYCATITIVSKNKILENSSMITKYSGSLRMKYLGFLDNFYLKSLGAIVEDIKKENFLNHNYIQINDSSFEFVFLKNNESKDIDKIMGINIPKGIIDYFICCTGWGFNDSIFNFNIEKTINNKYPKIDSNYQSTNINNLFFIGSLMHSHDYKISSGGFIHGFRYLIKLFMSLNYKVPYKFTTFVFNGSLDIYDKLAKYIQYRLNTSSDLYQMHSVLCDSFYFNAKENKIYYFENITKNIANNYAVIKSKNYVNVYLQNNTIYENKKFDVRNVNDFDIKSTFIHARFEIHFENRKTIIESMPEQLYLNFESSDYFHRIKDILKICPLII